MALIRINPTKMLVGGNKVAAKSFLGPARSQLEILKQDMSFQKLSQGIRRVWLNDDVYVECRKIFNYQECRVWVRPVSGEEEQVLRDAYFFVRIFHPGWFPVSVIQGDWRPNLCSEYGQTFDQLVVQVPDLKMDRLILWEPVLENETTIVPGQGAIILDVDLVNDIVHYVNPEFSFADDEAAILVWAKEYLDRVHYEGVQVQTDKRHPGWDTWPKVVETPDMKDEWLRTGKISAPDYNYFMCGNGYGHDGAEPEITIAMDEYFDPDDSGNYYHMMEPLLPDETGEINPIEMIQWEAKWCVEEGGDPEQIYKARLWPKLSENAIHYPGTVIPAKGSGVYQNCFYMFDKVNPFTGEETPVYFFARHCNAPGTTQLISVANGTYFTGRNDDRKFPTFFCYLSIPGSGSSNAGEEAWYDGGDLSSNGMYELQYNFSNKYGLGNGSALVTPLEVIPFAEMCLLSGLLDNGNSCLSDGVNCFANHEFVTIIIKGNGLSICGNADVRNMLPCSACVDDADLEFGYAKKQAIIIENHVWYGIKIPDPDQLNVNLFSLSSHIDRSAGSRAATSINWFGGSWMCGTTGYGGTDVNDFEDVVPLTCSNEFGVVYYLMNPQDFWWANADTGETEFWDIHTIREENPDEINSYRVLDLEDHINGILDGLRDGIRAYPTDDLDIEGPAGVLVGGLPKYPDTADGYYGLPAYGYHINDGFVYK